MVYCEKTCLNSECQPLRDITLNWLQQPLYSHYIHCRCCAPLPAHELYELRFAFHWWKSSLNGSVELIRSWHTCCDDFCSFYNYRFTQVSKQLQIPRLWFQSIICKHKWFGRVTTLPRSGRRPKLPSLDERKAVRMFRNNSGTTEARARYELEGCMVHNYSTVEKEQFEEIKNPQLPRHSWPWWVYTNLWSHLWIQKLNFC